MLFLLAVMLAGVLPPFAPRPFAYEVLASWRVESTLILPVVTEGPALLILRENGPPFLASFPDAAAAGPASPAAAAVRPTESIYVPDGRGWNSFSLAGGRAVPQAAGELDGDVVAVLPPPAGSGADPLAVTRPGGIWRLNAGGADRLATVRAPSEIASASLSGDGEVLALLASTGEILVAAAKEPGVVLYEQGPGRMSRGGILRPGDESGSVSFILGSRNEGIALLDESGEIATYGVEHPSAIVDAVFVEGWGILFVVDSGLLEGMPAESISRMRRYRSFGEDVRQVVAWPSAPRLFAWRSGNHVTIARLPEP